MTKKREAPTEPFKRAVAACVRAVAGKRDVEVAFAADRPLLMGQKVRLPEPPRRQIASAGPVGYASPE